MPKATFFRLPEEKRQRLEEAAWKEFCRVAYPEASINRMVQTAGIPRGSFYQYFEDKRDLFCYLFRQCGARLHALARRELSIGRIGPFSLLRWVFDQFARPAEPTAVQARVQQVLRLNLGADFKEILPDWKTVCRQELMPRLDLSALRFQGQEDQWQLMDILMTVTGRAIGMACSGKMTPEQARADLDGKFDLLRRGLCLQTEEEPRCFN